MSIFLDKYINQLIRFCKIPKFQNERAFSTILSLYLEEIIEKTLNEKYILLTVEFPIKKNNTNHSTNIDYVMVNEIKDKALLIELKTERQGQKDNFNNQIKLYSKLKENISQFQSHKDVINCNRKRQHKIKYKYLQESLGNSLDQISGIEIMYIVPNYMLEKELAKSDCAFIKYKIGFEVLINMKIDDDWEIIKKYLKELNIART